MFRNRYGRQPHVVWAKRDAGRSTRAAWGYHKPCSSTLLRGCGGLAPIHGGSEALIVIGRGSSDATASHQLWRFVRSTYSSLVCVAKHRFAISFVAAARPTMPEAVDQLMLGANGRLPVKRVGFIRTFFSLGMSKIK